MADDDSQDSRTEEATPRRLEQAFEEGQIAFSSELISGLILLVGIAFFAIAGKWFFQTIQNHLRVRLTFFQPMIEAPETILIGIRHDLQQMAIILAGLIVPLLAVILGASLLQTRFNLSTKPLEWNLNRMDPISGFKRILSIRSMVRGLVALTKVSCILIATWWIAASRLNEISTTSQWTLEATVRLGVDVMLSIGFFTAILMTIVGAMEYGFQWWKQRQELRMTLQQIRDENKDTEGDPQIRARIRRIAREMSRKRMMQAVPTATVIVTNPTHFAVALKYDPTQSPAPIVVAKGADFLAQQIINLAKENRVPVVERKPVARFLYSNVNLGQQIPQELFQAVAEILNFIQQIENRAA